MQVFSQHSTHIILFSRRTHTYIYWYVKSFKYNKQTKKSLKTFLKHSTTTTFQSLWSIYLWINVGQWTAVMWPWYDIRRYVLHLHPSLNREGRWGTSDDFTTSFLHCVLCTPLPSGTRRTPGLSIPWCSLPTSSSIYLIFFPLSFFRW